MSDLPVSASPGLAMYADRQCMWTHMHVQRHARLVYVQLRARREEYRFDLGSRGVTTGPQLVLWRMQP